jgi:hypothetical protein
MESGSELIVPSDFIRAFVAEIVEETGHEVEQHATNTKIRHKYWPRVHLDVFYYQLQLWGCMRRSARYYHGDVDLTDLDSCFFDLQSPKCAEKLQHWIRRCFSAI